MRAPAKPASNAAQRRIPAFSRKMRIARTVANKGEVKLRAVTSDRGASVSAVKKSSMPPVCNRARIACNFSLLVRRTERPERRNNGDRTTSPKTLRRNATTNGCKSSATWRTVTCMAVKISVVAIIRAAPRAGGGALA